MRAVVAALALVAVPSLAQAPRLLSHEGRLLRADGSPERATLVATFALYEAASGGTAAWTEALTITPSAAGYYAVLLGSTAALPEFDRPFWLGITLQGEAEMFPRARLAAAPYALRALRADDADRLGGDGSSQIVRFEGASGRIPAAALPVSVPQLSGGRLSASVMPASVPLLDAAQNTGSLAISGDLSVGGLFPGGGGNLIANPDLKNGERGWISPGASAGFVWTRTLTTDASAPVQSRRKLVYSITTAGPSGDGNLAAFTLVGLKLGADYNVSCQVRTLNQPVGYFNVQRYPSDYSVRSDVDLSWTYLGNGGWHRVSGTFNTAGFPNANIALRGFQITGTWDVTGCQLTEGKQQNTFSVSLPDLPCPNDSIELYGMCYVSYGSQTMTYFQAAANCKNLGMRLCSLVELSALHAAGASSCSWAWVADRASATTGYHAYPQQVASAGCNSAGVNVSAAVAFTNNGANANCCR